MHDRRWFSGARGAPGVVLVDVETSGFSPEKNRVIEVAALHTDTACTRVVKRWDSLLKTCSDPGPVHIHGITSAMLAGAPDPRAVLHRLAEELAGKVFVAHNASFDWGFLSAEAQRWGVPWPQVPVVCTVDFFRQLNLDVPNHKLQTLARVWGIPPGRAHRAAADVEVLYRALQPSLWCPEAAQFPRYVQSVFDAAGA